ncbi:MAG: acetate--CoA ligase family protein [Nanoarchaeota archaeon]
MLGLIESFKFLERNKIPIARWEIIEDKNFEKTKFAYPFFIKADLPKGEHKTEQKAVIKCDNQKQAEENLNFLRKKFPNQKIIIQESAEGKEMIIGIKEDNIFGKVLLIGFGGTDIEVIKDVQFRKIPLSNKEIHDAIKNLKLYDSLTKRKKFAIDEFERLAEKISKLKIKEMDLNPVILTESKALIVDARIEA